MFDWLLVVFGIGVPVLLMHELAHIAVAMGFGVKVKAVGVSLKGFYIIREPGTTIQNLIITLAGPGLHLLFILLMVSCWPLKPSWLFFWFFMANFISFGVNILPVQGSDGYRAWQLIRMSIKYD